MARPRISSVEKRLIKFGLQLTLSEKQELLRLAEVCGKLPATLAGEKIFKGSFPEPKIALTDGLISREEFIELPIRVQYTLTDTGSQLIPTIKLLALWGQDQMLLQGLKPSE
jgi:hypothetical protein